MVDRFEQIRLIFSILESSSPFTSFQEIYEALADKAATTAETLAQVDYHSPSFTRTKLSLCQMKTFLKVGFTLKSRYIIKTDEGAPASSEPVKEYTHIIPPADLPIKYILKTILFTVKPDADKESASASNAQPSPAQRLPIGSSPKSNSAVDLRSLVSSVATSDGLGSSRSYASAAPSRSPISLPLASAATPSKLSRPLPSPSASMSQPLPAVETRAESKAALEASTSAQGLDVTSMLREIDDLAAAIPALSREETCNLCKQAFPVETMRHISNKIFCVQCHQRVLALAKQRDIKLH